MKTVYLLSLVHRYDSFYISILFKVRLPHTWLIKENGGENWAQFPFLHWTDEKLVFDFARHFLENQCKVLDTFLHRNFKPPLQFSLESNKKWSQLKATKLRWEENFALCALSDGVLPRCLESLFLPLMSKNYKTFQRAFTAFSKL